MLVASAVVFDTILASDVTYDTYSSSSELLEFVKLSTIFNYIKKGYTSYQHLFYLNPLFFHFIRKTIDLAV
jgi:hypothetical protein